jgi:hypothetical protein
MIKIKEIFINFVGGSKEVYSDNCDEINMDSIGIRIKIKNEVRVFPYNNIISFEYIYEGDE